MKKRVAKQKVAKKRVTTDKKTKPRKTTRKPENVSLSIPLVDDIWKVVKSLPKTLLTISKDIDSISKRIADLPKTVIDAMRKEVPKDLGALATEVRKSAHEVSSAVHGTLAFVKHLSGRYSSWKKKEASFKHQLDGFFEDIIELGGQLPRMAGTSKMEPNRENVKPVVDLIPAIVLFGVAMGLEAIPRWNEAPRTLLTTAKKLPAPDVKVHPSHVTTMEDLSAEIKAARALARVLSKVLDLVISMLPDSLSVTVTVLGEGGGTVIAGHPVRFPFETAKAIIDLLEELLGDALEFHFFCKQDAFQGEVIERLDRIENAVCV